MEDRGKPRHSEPNHLLQAMTQGTASGRTRHKGQWHSHGTRERGGGLLLFFLVGSVVVETVAVEVVAGLAGDDVA